MFNIYGSIGNTILKNPSNDKYIIIFADNHDTLVKCDNYINIDDWLKSKFNTSHILLEEVTREKFDLEELWSTSVHTQKLKKLFLENKEKIIPIDIRPFLIPFNWEILEKENKIKLYEYLEEIDNFFCLANNYLKSKLNVYTFSKLHNTDLGYHYILIKNQYFKFLNKYKYLLKLELKDIIDKYKDSLDEINNLLDAIMEWYICACIYKCDTSHIIHTGLFHSESVIQLLKSIYNYDIVSENGINKINDNNINNNYGCVQLSKDHNLLFD
jgi:hypothetical protein